jgi:hypothetical protein
MSSPYLRDFSLLARILAMRKEQVARLEERREQLSQVRRWRPWRSSPSIRSKRQGKPSRGP